MQGQNGHTPVKGVDYWTDADQKAIYNETKQYVEDAILNGMNNLKVGGRNYLRDSDKSIFGWEQDLGTMPNEVLDQLAGQTITVSCDVEWDNFKSDSSKQNRLGFELTISGSDGKSYWLGAWKNPTTASGKERVSTQYTLPDGVTYTVQNNKQNGYVSINGQGKVSHVKVEIGNTATDWTPAPEDMATQSAFSELSQSLERLRSTVDSNYSQLRQLIKNQQQQITQLKGSN